MPANTTMTALQNARAALGVLLAGQIEAGLIASERRAIGAKLTERERMTIEKMDRTVAAQQQVVTELTRLAETPAKVHPFLKADLRYRLRLAADRHLRGVPAVGRAALVEKIAADMNL